MIDPPMQPTLFDERLLLRPLAADDHDALFAVASDSRIWTLHPAHDRWQPHVFRPFFDECLASKGAVCAVDRQTDRVIGSSRYDTRVCDAGEVEIGWTYLAREYWGGVWNGAMKRLMLEFAFTRYDAAIFLVGETNHRSRRALDKIGAVLTDRRQSWDMAGAPVDHLIYRITPADFATGPLAPL